MIFFIFIFYFSLQHQDFLRKRCQTAVMLLPGQPSQQQSLAIHRAAFHHFGSLWQLVPSCFLPFLLGSPSRVRNSDIDKFRVEMRFYSLKLPNLTFVKKTVYFYFGLLDYLTVRGKNDIEVSPFLFIATHNVLAFILGLTYCRNVFRARFDCV